MRYEPDHCEYPDGVNCQRIVPSFASIAMVLPYVVVTKNTSRAAAPTCTLCKYMGEASTVPSSETCCRRIVGSAAALIPVGASETPERAWSTPNCVQSCPFGVVNGGALGVWPVESDVAEPVDAPHAAARRSEQRAATCGTSSPRIVRIASESIVGDNRQAMQMSSRPLCIGARRSEFA